MTLSNKAKAFSVVNLLQLPVEATGPGHAASTTPGGLDGYMDIKPQSLFPLKHEGFKDGAHSRATLLPPEDAVNNLSELDKIKEMWMLLGYDQGKSSHQPEIHGTENLLKRGNSEDYRRHRQLGKVRCHGNEKRPRDADHGDDVCSSKKQRLVSGTDHGWPDSSQDVACASCFCHGETMYCQHPGVLTILDTNGSGSTVLVELCHSDLWSSFHRLGTEMIITKSGRRMFPVLKLRVSGLARDKMYSVRLEFAQPDTRKYRYIYNNSRWMVSGSGDALTSRPCHVNPEGPVSGQALCSQILSFERLKMTNTDCIKPGQVSLVSMQKFQPQIVIEEVVPGESRSSAARLEHYVINFTQTSFMAVTAYQNQQITTLKIASNPFAKGFRESGKPRVMYEALTSQYPGLMAHKSYSDFASVAPLLPGLFRSGIPKIANYFDEDRVYSQMSNNDKRLQSPKSENGSSASDFTHFTNKSSSAFGYPFYYLPFLHSVEEQKWRTGESGVTHTFTDIHQSLTTSTAREPSSDTLSSLLNLDPSGNTSEERQKLARLHSTDADKYLQIIYQQYLRCPHELLFVTKSGNSTQKNVPQPYGLHQSDSNSPSNFSSVSQDLSFAKSESSLMPPSQISNNKHLQSVLLKSSHSPNSSPRYNTELSATPWLSNSSNFDVIRSLTPQRDSPNFDVMQSFQSRTGCLTAQTSI